MSISTTYSTTAWNTYHCRCDCRRQGIDKEGTSTSDEGSAHKEANQQYDITPSSLPILRVFNSLVSNNHGGSPPLPDFPSVGELLSLCSLSRSNMTLLLS